MKELPSRGPTVTSPALVVQDYGTYPPRGRLAKSPCQAVMTLLPFLSPHGPRLLGVAGLVGIRRTCGHPAGVAAGGRDFSRVLRLSREEAAALPALGDGVMLWGTARHRRFVLVRPTDAECGLLGEARRID